MSAGLGGTADSLQSDAVVKSIAEETGGSEFWAVEQLAWGDSAVADVYERSFNSLTRQCIPALLDGESVQLGPLAEVAFVSHVARVLAPPDEPAGAEKDVAASVLNPDAA